MTDDLDSKKSRFKSKWSKLLKPKQSDENEEAAPHTTIFHALTGTQPAFALSQETLDFLKPSTDRAASTRPKLDISLAQAQRWPEAHEVRKAANASPGSLPPDESQGVNGWRKRRRREGLSVAFVRTVPEIIGIGGDESLEPTVEVGRAKRVGVGRSFSEKRPSIVGVAEDDGVWSPGLVAQAGKQGSARAPAEEVRPAPVRRAMTGTLSLGQDGTARVGISRTPTGFPSNDAVDAGTTSEQGTESAVEKQKRLRVDEGRTFRRASGMFGTAQDKVVDENAEPESAVSPERPSPFADPRYVKRHSGNAAVAPKPAEQRDGGQSREDSRETAKPSQASGQQHAADVPAALLPAPHQSARRSHDGGSERHMETDILNRIPLPSYHAPSRPSSDTAPSHTPPQRDESGGYYQSQQSKVENGNYGQQQYPQYTHSRSQSQTQPAIHVQAPVHDRTNTHEPSPDSPRGSTLGQPRPSPHSRSPSLNDYFSAPKQAPSQAARSPLMQLRKEETSRPSSAQSHRSFGPPTNSSGNGNPAAELAFADFASRVAHMKGVFRLTAEREQPADRCSPSAWLRAGLWWYLRGKSGLEILLGQRSRSRESEHRELLTQAHVDLAKAWWIPVDPLESYAASDAESPPLAQSTNASEMAMRYGCAVLKSHLKSLCYSLAKSNIMPPPQSLIQGQDTRIWLEYPNYTADAAAVLRGETNSANVLSADSNLQRTSPLRILPLGDTRDMHCYNRFLVEASINTDEGETDRVTVPCMLTVMRGQREHQAAISIASQSELISINVGPDHEHSSTPTWRDVSWKAGSLSLVVHLSGGYDLTVRCHDRDYRALWNMFDYTSRISQSLRAQDGETLVHEARLMEVQYTDPSNASAFPTDKVRGCLALVWERNETYTDGSGSRAMHRGFRVLVVTDTAHKTLSSFSHEIDGSAPLQVEFHTDVTANGTTALVLKVREEKRQCRILLVFRDAQQRQAFNNVLNGLDIKEDETIVGKIDLTSMRIEPVNAAKPYQNPLAELRWQKLGVTNWQSDDPNSRIPDTVGSLHLRIVARHEAGCITDRLNLGKGELQLRIPCDGSHSVQILRQPQQDLSLALDPRNAPTNTLDDCSDLLRLAKTDSTIRTFAFPTPQDQHAFQAAITGQSVRYDSLASSFAISRRRMVVPVYTKWTASNVRIQIVANSSNTVIQLLAFMEDFPHADALCFQIKSTDAFELKDLGGRGDSKRWGVRLVDAKFSLPEEGSDVGARRFVNLENLVYASEHDDVTVGFGKEEERDAFAAALPAGVSRRTLTMRRRI